MRSLLHWSKRTPLVKRFALIQIAAATVALAPFSATGATFTVIQTGNSGDGSLRTAITNANNTPGSDLIVFDLPGSGPHTILLTSTLPTITGDLSILNDRSGDETVTIQASTSGFRIFTLGNGVTGFYVLISGVTLSNGNVAALSGTTAPTGAAIRNVSANVTLRNCTFAGNAAKSGGAVWNGWNLLVTNCTLSGNSANLGGAIYNTALLQLTNSTFDGNSATSNGGGVYSIGGSPAVLNCTFGGNSAPSGGALDGFQFDVANTIFLRGNTGANLNGTINSKGSNLSDDSAGGDNGTGPGGGLNASGDIRNTNPQLAVLASNGGLTQTRALLPSSPAINAGNDANAPGSDQRNYSRSGVSDIGAFEYGGTPAPPSPAVLTVTNTNDSGPGSLRQVIASAAAGTTIEFAPGVTGVITLTSGHLVIDKDLTVHGPGASVLTLDGNNTSRIFQIYNPFLALTANLSGLTIRGGRVTVSPNAGGGMYNSAALTIQDCVISDNYVIGIDATSNTTSVGAIGAGIYSFGPLILINTVVSGNSAVGGNGSPSANSSIYAQGSGATGGGIYQRGDLTLTNCRIGGNMIVGGHGGDGAPPGGALGGAVSGGGIYQSGPSSKFTLMNSGITDNSAHAGKGGAGAAAYGTPDSTTGGYGAGANGGGLYASADQLSLIDCSVSNNIAVAGNGGAGTNGARGGSGGKGLGGGLFDTSRLSTISNCTFSANSVTGGTGGSQFLAAAEEGSGGAIYRATGNRLSDAAITLVNSTISDNSATGGGVSNYGNPGRGGGIAHTWGALTSINCTIANNAAAGTGGDGLSITSPAQGGCLYIDQGGTATLRNTIVASGTAAQGPDVSGALSGSSSFNLIGNGSNMTGITNGTNGNKVGTSASPIDPQLNPLTNNGGPTLTRSFSGNSPAIDAGDNTAITGPPFSGPPFYDQRGSGFPRIVNGTVDIGSFEAATIAPSPTPTATPTATPTPTPTPTPIPTPTPTATPGLVANVSTRLQVGKDDDALFEGFIIQGPAGSAKKIIVRALGPFLGPFGVPDPLVNPTLDIFQGSTKVASNNDWRTTQTGGLITADQSAEIAASGFAPSNELESAIIANLAPGSYTAIVRGLGNTTGIGLVDAFDLSATSSAKVVNFATRGLVQPGDKLLTAGFIIQNGSVRAVIRAIGPSLTGPPFNITNALPDTTLQLRDQNGGLVQENDDWQTDQKAELESTGLQPSNAKEAALVRTIPPGQYTAQVRGKPESTGIGVVEVYFLQ